MGINLISIKDENYQINRSPCFAWTYEHK